MSSTSSIILSTLDKVLISFIPNTIKTITSTINNIAYDRAKRAREIEYIKEIAKDDVVDERVLAAESTIIKETTYDYLEAAELLDSISDDDTALESAEIDRILSAEDDITFNEMADIDNRADKLF